MNTLLERHRDLLTELPPLDRVMSLGEGNTPLVRSERLLGTHGRGLELYLKFEGSNPTGSFKDRGMTAAVSVAVQEGAKALVCASTGNTSASAAAYAARAGLQCFVLVPDGEIAMGKLAQAMVHGSHVLQVKGNFDRALDLVRELGSRLPLQIVNSTNPHRLVGQMTAAFEVAEALGGAPDFHALPVGNAGNITAYWRGYRRLLERGRTTSTPRMLGFQAAGSAPLVLGHPVEHPVTIATAIKIGKPASGVFALEAARDSGGAIQAVTDEEILETYRDLARLEGVFCEPSSAAGLAGVRRLAAAGFFPAGSRIAVTLTGHGLKDPDNAMASAATPMKVEATFEAVSRVLEARLV